MTRRWAWGVLLAVAFGAATEAQDAGPRRRRSPEGSSATEVGGRHDEREGYVGGKWLEIRYGRPIKRGRDLFGPADFAEFLNDGAPVWRAGANESTRLITEAAIEIGGTRIPPGEYTVFIDLARDAWTFIVSRWAAQIGRYDTADRTALYGAFDYTPDKDVVRTPMTIEAQPYSHDQLHWEFLDVTAEGGRLAIFWDHQMAWVPFAIVR
jgi:hypothetical protein